MGFSIMTVAAVKGLQFSQPDILGNIRPISAGSELSPQFGVYGVIETDLHPFLTPEVEDRLRSYVGGHFILVLFPNRLEVRLRDRSVYSNFPALIQLGKDLIRLQTAKS